MAGSYHTRRTWCAEDNSFWRCHIRPWIPAGSQVRAAGWAKPDEGESKSESAARSFALDRNPDPPANARKHRLDRFGIQDRFEEPVRMWRACPRGLSTDQRRHWLAHIEQKSVLRYEGLRMLVAPKVQVNSGANQTCTEADCLRHARYDVEEPRRSKIHKQIFDLETPMRGNGLLQPRTDCPPRPECAAGRGSKRVPCIKLTCGQPAGDVG